MNPFERVVQILDELVSGENFGAHGAFWRSTTRDDFVAKSIFGFPLLQPGDGSSSNLVKALLGEAPFGSDLPDPPPGAIFRRMPADRDPASAEDIEFIRQWIDDGCPDEASGPIFSTDCVDPVDPEEHLALWRVFDNWAMFESTPEVDNAIGTFFGTTAAWREFARDASRESAWQAAIEQESARAAIELLAERQFQTFSEHFGLPIPLGPFLDAFEKFGDDSLPDDPDRPVDVRHNMNGAIMWQMWAAFADACLHLEIRPRFWRGMGRGILLGQMNDGVFRERFTVIGFEKTPEGKQNMRTFVKELDDGDVASELRQRFVDSGTG